jgi:hypothetical protein
MTRGRKGRESCNDMTYHDIVHLVYCISFRIYSPAYVCVGVCNMHRRSSVARSIEADMKKLYHLYKPPVECSQPSPNLNSVFVQSTV